MLPPFQEPHQLLCTLFSLPLFQEHLQPGHSDQLGRFPCNETHLWHPRYPFDCKTCWNSELNVPANNESP
uniref:Uncharacterized protein n=1 Tax=Lotus japonicus TaxID=34305 RepID=I3SKU8_LOTJA|nr:unknown [Lotus japonicus]